MSTLSIQLAADTHKGMRRSGNEDTFGVFAIPGYEAAFVVCDGMGGLQAGDIAANEAVRVIEATLKARLLPDSDPAQVLLAALRGANDAVNSLARPRSDDDEPTQGNEPAPSNALMGTTVVAGVVRAGTLWVAHAGDSRAYRFRSGRLERLTNDHSFVDEQVRAGNMTESEARVSRFRNMITRAIGIDAVLEPEVRQETLLPGDTILVCSDGLTTMLLDDEIAPLLAEPRGSLERQVQVLIDAANRKGGHDNITVLLVGAGGKGASEGDTAPLEKRGGGTRAPEGSRESRRRRKPAGPSTVVLMLAMLGGLAFLTLLLLALSPILRSQLAANLSGKPTTLSAPVLPDYRRLTYSDTPLRIVDSPLASRSQLALLPEGKVVFVRNSGEQVILAHPSGPEKVLVSDLKVPDKVQADMSSPDNEVYVATDPQGNIYISYAGRGVIKKLSPEGAELTRISKLDRPGALTIEPKSGDIYFIDATNHVQVLRAKLVASAKPSPK
ncbi:protein phosphatase 2C domain-containing protein [Armatimonas rosea]|uniref:Serine/threonine protein phosphatase PrpC n=1 Tax=Armatimonas rosea TaxID=685828 RepID=A0A7W9W9Z3_ARMRO|nr:protein phosphatase 2C domain-containing protein [Armatimonas rosea]MBB6053745.1 serine/threonine protein phosphatase PrpC [Armatimonas rosea]